MNKKEQEHDSNCSITTLMDKHDIPYKSQGDRTNFDEQSTYLVGIKHAIKEDKAEFIKEFFDNYNQLYRVSFDSEPTAEIEYIAKSSPASLVQYVFDAVYGNEPFQITDLFNQIKDGFIARILKENKDHRDHVVRTIIDYGYKISLNHSPPDPVQNIVRYGDAALLKLIYNNINNGKQKTMLKRIKNALTNESDLRYIDKDVVEIIFELCELSNEKKRKFVLILDRLANWHYFDVFIKTETAFPPNPDVKDMIISYLVDDGYRREQLETFDAAASI